MEENRCNPSFKSQCVVFNVYPITDGHGPQLEKNAIPTSTSIHNINFRLVHTCTIKERKTQPPHAKENTASSRRGWENEINAHTGNGEKMTAGIKSESADFTDPAEKRCIMF
jgi:hypothetical protein